jgi:hypothetical protein
MMGSRVEFVMGRRARRADTVSRIPGSDLTPSSLAKVPGLGNYTAAEDDTPRRSCMSRERSEDKC